MTADPNDASAHFDRGNELAEKGLFDDAIAEYREADELWQKDQSQERKRALYGWGRALHSQKRHDEAAGKYREAIGVDQEYPWAYYGLGRVLADQEHFDDAIGQYHKADELSQMDEPQLRMRILLNWARAMRLQENYDEAATKYREAMGIDPEHPCPWAYYGLGRVLACQGHSDAIEQSRKADELWRNDQSKNRKFALRSWADALGLQEHYGEAAKKYQEAIDIDATYPAPYYYLGQMLVAQKHFDEAITQYQKAYELLPSDESKKRMTVLYRWAVALHSLKRYGEATEKHREAIGIDPDDPKPYYGLGLVLADQDQFADAIPQYQKAYELGQKTGAAHQKFVLHYWAEALRRQKRYGEAAGKYEEIISIAPNDPMAYNGLGDVLAAQELFDQAIEQYRKADELWQKNGCKEPKDRKFALWGWGSALLEQERFEDANAKYGLAAKIAPQDATAVFLYGNSLAALGRYRDAITQFDKTSTLDPGDPLPHHNMGYFLFQLGCYEEGWNEWRAARLCYESALKGELRGEEQLQMAVSFGDVFRDIYKNYKKSEKVYQQVIEQQGDNADACAGLAILYQQWANSDAATPEIHARLNYQVGRAIELLNRQLDKGSNFKTLLSLADLYIETSDWAGARDRLTLADSVYGKYRLKRAEVTARLGLVCLGSEEHAEAVKNFRQALLVKPGDLTLRSNLGDALLKSKRFEAAQDEFARVLKLAPGNIDALLGAAQVSIELADDGDPDQYRIAEQHLSDALKHGRNKESGSKSLQNSEIAKIYYMRGYARTKSYEAGASRIISTPLLSALCDFRQCKNLDPNNRKAPAAIEKICQRLRRGVSESWVDMFGSIVISILGLAVFLLAQLDFFFRGWLPAQSPVIEPTAYIALTFGSLLFMIAGLSLPKVLKLKVGGITLEKASVDQVSAPSTLGISPSGSLVIRPDRW